MKSLQTLAVLLVLALGAKAQIDSSKTQKDTVANLILYPEIVKVEGAKPVIIKESQELVIKKTVGDNIKAKSATSTSPQSMLQMPASSAGPTLGQLDVSATGGATYTVPINLPPGLGNMVPQIALAYNSQGGNGIAGLGWNISGLSAITRIPSTTFHDNKITAVNFNTDDRFALDGQRLLLKNGTYGGDGAEYQTESYSNLKIISRGVSPFGANYGPAYFEVFYPDGSKAVYGETANSRTSSSFALTYMQNPIGARINYSYSVSDNTFIVTEIAYGNLGANQTLNKVNFHYSEINRAEMGYTAGDRLYRKSLLNKISITANGNTYRNFALDYENVATLNYKRIVQISEYDGSESNARTPLYFTYGSTGNIITINSVNNLSITGIASNNSEVVTADFTGNGSMDFLLVPKNNKNKFWAFYDMEPNSPYMQLGYEINTGTFKEIFPGTILSWNDKVLPGQSIMMVKPNGADSYKFDTYVPVAYHPALFQYDKVWNNAPKAWGYYSECDDQFHDGPSLDYEFISGDFNGDGLTDIIAINRPYYGLVTYERLDENNPWDPYPQFAPQVSLRPPPIGNCVQEYGNMDYSNIHFINMDRRITANYVTNVGYLNKSYTTGDKIYTADFNGDGKTDILHITNGNMYAYSLNTSNNYLQLLWQTSDSRINLGQQILLGDFNGDGKQDIMFACGSRSANVRPTRGDPSTLFAMFLSTGRGFIKQERHQPFASLTGSWDGTYLKENYLVATDVNNDGKTDVVAVYTSTQNYIGGTAEIDVYPNMGPSMGTTSNDEIDFNAGGGAQSTSIGAHYPIPLFLNPDKENPKLEFGLLSMNAIRLFRSGKDFKSEAQITSISQGGITHNISYKNLDGQDDYYDEMPYQGGYEQTYPYVDLHNIPGLNVVDKITRTYNNGTIQQVFGYSNAVSNLEGLGFLGFGQTMRSNWHVDEYDGNRMFNISITDPQLRGAPIQAFTTRYPVLPSAAAQTASQPDITLSNPISTAQTTEASNSITLTDGFEADGANGTFIAQITNPATGIDDGASIYSYITRTDYTYDTQLLPSKVFINTPTSVITKDLLNGTNTLQLNEYDSYYNVTKTTTNLSGAGVKTEEITYDNNPSGPDYYIGRPLTHKTTMSAAGDTHSSEEEFTYTGFLPTQIKKKGHDTPWVTENLTYDTFGNITQKSISTASGTRTTSATYDGTGRFPISQTDVEGLTSTATYDAATGNLLTSTNPYGQTATNVYDIWGRLTETTNYLGKKSYNSYGTHTNGYLFSQSDDEGYWKAIYTNHLGQTIETMQRTITGSWVGAATEYDVYGRAYRQSQPAAVGSYNQWNETEFDQYGRVKKTTAYTGKVTQYSYNGLSATVNDGTKSVITTKNALEQTISQQDPGGTINYSYYAHGGLKTADYGGSTQTLEYDGWGRKTKLVDPSAGQYTYTYNGFGEITQETTPKGVTNYTYDNATGKLTGKTLTGDDTGLGYTYSYNNTTKLLDGLTFTNADGNNATYTYTYDNDKRLISTVEDNLHARFTKSYTYDAFGRIATEGYEAKDKASNITANRTVAYTYQNGELLQAVDQATGQILSKTNTLKPNGQLATELQGSSLKTTYNYDTFNLPQNTVTERIGTNPATLMTLGYSFDALRGNLNSRSNTALSWSETFGYDNLDRLTNFNDNNGNNSQTYDARGRITNNSALGNYGYSGASYQQTELTSPTPTAVTWYQDRALQQMSFNAFKKPVNINEDGKEQIDFQYNAALQRSTMYYGSDDADKTLRPMRRHYSEDGGMEITRNIATGETSFVFYLSGDAYDAPAIYKEAHNSSGTTQDLYYLHRDHLGSIVLITDIDGNAVEKRQFDAWGNIVALTDGNGSPLTAFVITDRGYTGHEHLLNVGLINMNGRLYDPKLHRFVSPDNHVQDPFNTQNFNRYGYVMNNPLIMSDPSGELWFIPILIGMAIGVGTNGIINTIENRPFFQGAVTAGLLGGLGGGVSSLIGSAASGITSTLGRVATQTVAHGFLGGTMNVLSGGDFWSGMASGALGSLAAWGTGSLLDGSSKFWNATGTIASGSLMGGVGAEISGGNFWEGVRNGAISSGLNHAAHSIQQAFQNKKGVTVTYDGEFVRVVDKNGNVLYEGLATSGKGKYMNDPNAQNEQNLGPIPEGEYFFDSNNWNYQTPIRQLYNILARNGDWGFYNVKLTPVSYTGTRHSFYLHGGSYPGSAGCIDAGRNITKIQTLTANQGKVPVIVKYKR